MKNLRLLLLMLPFIFLACEMEEMEKGELFDDSPTTPEYSADILEKVWTAQVNFSEFDFDEFVLGFALIDDILLMSSSYYIYAHSADNGELLWVFKRPPMAIIPQLTDITMVDDKLYFFSTINQRPGIIALNKYNGELESTLSFDDIPDINGFLLVRCFHDNKVYFSSILPNNNSHDYYDYSYFIYEFDLETQNLNLLFQDESIYGHWDYSRIEPVINSVGTSLFFQYIKHDSEDYYVQIVEIPNNGGEAEVVVSDKLESEIPFNFRSNNSIAVHGNYLIGNFERNAEFPMRAYDLSKGGERIWQTGSNFVPRFYMDNLYFIREQTYGPLQLVDVLSGDVFWSQNISTNDYNFNFLENQPLACLRTRNTKVMSILDLNTGATLVNISFEELGINPTSNFFQHKAFSYNNGEKLILATTNGRLLCFELPF